MGATSPIHFIDYNKISDTIMWFDNSHVLKFCVTLQKSDKYGNMTSFHKEYSYINKSNNCEQLSIVRNYSFYYIIEDLKNKNYKTNNTSIIFRAAEVELLRMVLTNNIYPWYIGNTKSKIFGKDSNNRLIVKGSPKVQFPVNNQSFIEFRPIVLEYEMTDEQKEGIRMIINDINNYIDISIDKLLEFGNYIIHTDMINAAMTMLNYVKIKPYGENMNSFGGGTTNYTVSGYSNNGERKGFF